MKNITKRKVTRTLKFSEIINSQGEFIGGGILNKISHVEKEMWVEVMTDTVLDDNSDEWLETGRLQIHLGSSRRALEELGVFLLALAHYRPPKPSYSLSFDLNDHKEQPSIHLVIHLPQEENTEKVNFSKIHTVAKGHISPDGTNVSVTTDKPHTE